ncbi:MAG: primase C-terminal domain-containing protein [Collinsella sp.]
MERRETGIPSEITENRNETLFSLGRSFLSRGTGHDEVATLIRSLNATICRPPLPEVGWKLTRLHQQQRAGNAERDARNGGVTAADIAELESRHGPLHRLARAG